MSNTCLSCLTSIWYMFNKCQTCIHFVQVIFDKYIMPNKCRACVQQAPMVKHEHVPKLKGLHFIVDEIEGQRRDSWVAKGPLDMEFGALWMAVTNEHISPTMREQWGRLIAWIQVFEYMTSYTDAMLNHYSTQKLNSMGYSKFNILSIL